MTKYICKDCKRTFLSGDNGDNIMYCPDCHGSLVYSAGELIANIRDAVEEIPLDSHSTAVDKAEDIQGICDLLTELIEDEK